MILSQLSIHSFRNIHQLSLALSGGLNIFWGDNGSGKSSILEALHLIARGRSFRTSRINDMIMEGKRSLVVRATKKNGDVLALEKAAGKTQAKKNATDVNVMSLASQLPMLFMDSDSHRNFFSDPAFRRQFFDWIVFHVEQGYGERVAKYQKCLKMRNSALKQGADHRSWDPILIEAGQGVMLARQSHLAEISKALASITSQNANLITYSPSAKQDFKAMLGDAADKDQRLGYTSVGPHRDDYHYYDCGRRMSQGQQKLAFADLLSAANAYLSQQGVQALVAIDDMCAELDVEARRTLVDRLLETGAQVLLTGVLERDLKGVAGASVFHVKQGRA